MIVANIGETRVASQEQDIGVAFHEGFFQIFESPHEQKQYFESPRTQLNGPIPEEQFSLFRVEAKNVESVKAAVHLKVL